MSFSDEEFTFVVLQAIVKRQQSKLNFKYTRAMKEPPRE